MSVGGLHVSVVGALILGPVDLGLTSPDQHPLTAGSRRVKHIVFWSQFGAQSMALPLAR